MPALIIIIDCDDPSDLDWLRSRCHDAVENQVTIAYKEERLDGRVEVSWEIED